MTVSIRLLSRVEDLRRCEIIERTVWGLDDREVLSGTHMRAMVHAGGMAAGAFVAGELAGFVLGFLAREGPSNCELSLHSHLLAVLPEYRGRRLGVRLKQFQRAWCLEQGLRTMTWTFDPLQIGNARLNLEHLAAYSDRYLIDFYGRFGGTLSGTVSTDRLLVTWDLDREEVVAQAEGRQRPLPALEGLPSALAWCPGDEPGEPDLDVSAAQLLVALPHDFTGMLVQAPDRAERWRNRVRAVLTHHFDRGCRVSRVVAGQYLVEGPVDRAVDRNITK